MKKKLSAALLSPQTGSDNTMLFGLAGVALLGAGLFLIGRNRKRNA